MTHVECHVPKNKVHFAKQIANRLEGKIEKETEQGDLAIQFGDSQKAHRFDRFMFVIKQSFA